MTDNGYPDDDRDLYPCDCECDCATSPVVDVADLKDEAIRFCAKLDKPISFRKRQSDFLSDFIDHLSATGHLTAPDSGDELEKLDMALAEIEPNPDDLSVIYAAARKYAALSKKREE